MPSADTHSHTHTHTHTHACMHTHTHACMHTHTATILALYIKLNEMDISVATVVRLLPILQSPSTIDVM